jgi:hypothetical protein
MPAAIPLAIVGSAIGGIASSAIGAHAAGSAADAQVAAANRAADLQHQDAQSALDFNKLQYGNSLNLMSPYYNTGTSALGRLGFLMGLKPNQGLPPGVVNPNAPQNFRSFPDGAMNTLRQGTGPNGTPGDAVLPMSAGGNFNANRFSTMASMTPPGQAPFQGTSTTGIGGQTGAPVALPGSSSPGNFGPAQFAGDPNDPKQFPGNPDANNVGNGGIPITGTGIDAQGSTGLGDPSPFGPGGMGDITNAGVTNASTNQGGTGQVPRTDGGTDPTATGDPNSGFGSLASNFGEKWAAPTGVTEVNDPGYQFRINQGLQALQNSAAARGKLLSGDTAKGLNDYAQNSASGEYGNVYNRALNDYTTRYNAFNQDQNTLFNRFATLSGIGQTSAGQLSNAGLSSAGTNANILLNSGQQIGNDYLAAGNARGSGYINSANAINSGISGVSNMAMLLAMMKNQGGPGAGGYGV